MEFSLEIFLLLFAVAILAGWVDTIAGGGGLITIPTMLLVGIPSAAALATNKLQGTGGTLIASTYFLKKKIVNLNSIKLTLFMTFFGSMFGGWLLLKLNSTVLDSIVPFLLILMGFYFLFSPNIGKIDKTQRVSYFVFSICFASILGFYDGFFGPGTGMFMALAFVNLCGYNLPRATAHAKVLNFTSRLRLK